MNDHAIIQHVLLRVQFVLSRKQNTSSLTSAISRVQFVPADVKRANRVHNQNIIQTNPEGCENCRLRKIEPD